MPLEVASSRRPVHKSRSTSQLFRSASVFLRCVAKEKIYDLLNKSHLKRLVTDGPGLKLKLVKDIFTVENLYTFECRSADDVLALYHFGLKNKVVASHNMNNSSSRSHSMLKISIECVDSRNPDNVVLSTLQLVDLAGSER